VVDGNQRKMVNIDIHKKLFLTFDMGVRVFVYVCVLFCVLLCLCVCVFVLLVLFELSNFNARSNSS